MSGIAQIFGGGGAPKPDNSALERQEARLAAQEAEAEAEKQASIAARRGRRGQTIFNSAAGVTDDGGQRGTLG